MCERPGLPVVKVKEVSTSVVDGVNAVKEYADENRAGATSVVNDMSTIALQTNELTDKTYSSLEMTKSISNQVAQVSNLVEETVTLSQQSVEHASLSNEQLQDVMVSAREMKELANKVDDILINFKQEFAKVKTETGTINQISSQTNLLALNYNNIRSIDELPAHIFDEIMHFFKVYKQLENKQTDVKELYDRETAEKIVAEAINGYVDKFCR